MEQLIARNLKSFRAYLTRADFRRQHGHVKSAASNVKIAYQLAPDELDVLALVAEFMLGYNPAAGADTSFDLLDVRSQLKQAQLDHPDAKRLIVALALLDLRDDMFAAVEAQLRAGLQIHPDDEQLLQLYADVLIYRGKVDIARQELDRLRKTNKLPSIVMYLEARLAMVHREYLVASRLLVSIRPQLIGRSQLQTAADLHLARCYEKLGQNEQCLAAYRRAATLDVLSVDARMDLAYTLFRLGRFDEALTNYRQLTAVPGVALEIARLMVLRNLDFPEDERNWGEVDQALDVTTDDKQGLVDVILHRTSI